LSPLTVNLGSLLLPSTHHMGSVLVWSGKGEAQIGQLGYPQNQVFVV
jgi:hypothetical protein